MNKAQLKAEWNNNPIGVLAVGAMVATAAAKLIDSMSAAQGRRAYAKQVNHSTSRKSRR